MTNQFPGQNIDEKIEVVIHKHWFVYIKTAIKCLFFFIIPSIALIAGIIIAPDFFLKQEGLFLITIAMIYLLFILEYTYITILSDALDTIIVTDERLIGIDQVGFLTRRVSETPLPQIQDIECYQRGTFCHLFDYGYLKIQTASEKLLFEMGYIKNPLTKCRSILDIRNRCL